MIFLGLALLPKKSVRAGPAPGNIGGSHGDHAMSDVLYHLRRAALGHDGGLTDGQLLERFLIGGEEAAFKFCLWLMVLAALWLTLWARQLRKPDRQATK